MASATHLSPLSHRSHLPSRSPLQCQACGSTKVVRLAMALADGTPTVFTSCRGCERREWQAPEGALDTSTVLARLCKPDVGSVPVRALSR